MLRDIFCPFLHKTLPHEILKKLFLIIIYLSGPEIEHLARCQFRQHFTRDFFI